MEKRWKRLVIVGGGLLLLVGVLLTVWLMTRPVDPALYESVTIQAEQQGKHGIPVDSTFSVTLGSSAKEDQLRAMLEVKPSIPFQLTGSGRGWKLLPSEPLERNQVYTFRVKNAAGETVRSFAFQTESDLLVQSVYPRENRRYTPSQATIEITFNAEQVDPTEFVRIEPETAGTWVMRGYTAVFQPAAPLENDSIYRVTLQSGLQAANEMALAEDYVFSFETDVGDSWNKESLRLNGSFSEAFLPEDPVVVGLSGDNLTDVPFETSVYRLPNAEAYVGALTQYNTYYRERVGPKKEFHMDLAGLELVTQSVGALVGVDAYGNWGYAVAPEELTTGYYAISVRGIVNDKECEVQKLVQINDLAVYTQAVDGETLVWVNSATDGKPVSGMRVDLQDMESESEQRGGVTDQNGVLRLDTGDLQKGYLTLSGTDRPLYFTQIDLSQQREPRMGERYFATFYSDRELYQPTDSIRFWGMIRPRMGEQEVPTWVDAELWGQDETALVKVRVPLNQDGTFTGKLELDSLTSDWYTIAITNGEKDGNYLLHGVEVSAFEKPAFVIESATDRDWYYVNEPIKVDVEASYLDGQPVADSRLLLNFQTIGTDAGVEIALDAQGKGAYTGQEPEGGKGTYVFSYPGSDWFSLSNADPEDVEVTGSGQTILVYSKNLVDIVNSQPAELTIRSALLNEEHITNDEWAARQQPDGSWLSPFDWYAGTPTSLPITLQIYRTHTVKVPVSQYYDEIGRRMVTKYDVQRNREFVETIEAQTVDGKAVVSLNPAYVNSVEDWYFAEVSYANGLGGTIQFVYHFGMEQPDLPNLNSYSFTDGIGRPDAKVDEVIPLGLYNHGKQEENKGRVLYSVMQMNTLKTEFYSEATHALRFEEAYIPNITVCGAYFDGRHIYMMNSYNCTFDSTERELQVTVEADQETYQPGGEAQVRVKVSDAQGKPVAGQVCLGVVDEAIFEMMPQNLDLLGQLYQGEFWADVKESVSYQQYDLEPDPGTGGMGGGGSGDENAIRTDFVDTALFQTVAVGESGEATVTLRLPDNITRWRLTAAALTSDLKAGTGLGSAVATLPFYLRPLVSDVYLEGDDVTVLSRSVCDASAGQAELTAELRDVSGKVLQTLGGQAKPGQTASFPFGKLSQGSYTVVFKGTSQAGTDAVEQEFLVQPAGLAVPTESNLTLEELSTVQSVRYPVRITVYDPRREVFVQGLELLQSLKGNRTETLTANHLANVLDNELLDQQDRKVITKDGRLDAIQDYDSGIKPLAAAEPEADVTAKMLLCAPEMVNRTFAKTYLYEMLASPASTPDTRVMAKVGLAALQEPMLLDLQWTLQQEDLTATQRLYLGAGLAALGDYEGAKAVYQGITPGAAEHADGFYFPAPSLDEQIRVNGAALLLTSIAGDPDSDALMRYLCAERAKPDSKALVDLELLGYLTYFRVRDEKTVQVSYQSDDGKQTVDLGERGIWSTWMTRAQLEQAAWKNTDGKARARVVGTQMVNEATADATSDVTVQKTITPVGGANLRFGQRARVELTITFGENAPYGTYELYDWIPSGMRYQKAVDNVEATGTWMWPRIYCEGQQLTGMIWRGKDEGIMPLTDDLAASTESNPNTDAPNPGTDDADGLGVEQNPSTDEPNSGTEESQGEGNVVTMAYYVQCVLPGEYSSEGVWVRLPETGEFLRTQRETLTIEAK